MPNLRRRQGAACGLASALPKPAAVFTAYDLRAQEAIEACKESKLSIPKQVAILGVDTGTSIHRAIEDRRLALVRERLKTTRLSIEKISRLCGYTNTQRLKYVFKARFGISMSKWRADPT